MLSKRGDGGESGSIRRFSSLPEGGGGNDGGSGEGGGGGGDDDDLREKARQLYLGGGGNDGGSGEGGGGGDDDDLLEKARQLYLGNLDVIDKAARFVSRNRGHSAEDTEDFCQEAKLYLLQKPRVLGVFRGEPDGCTLLGYLIGVLANFALDIYRRHSGKWHTCAEAKRLGPEAEALETLRYRDNLPIELALEQLLRKFPDLTREQALKLDEKLKPRSLRQWVGDAPLEKMAALSHADDDVENHELESIERKVKKALDEALDELPLFDRVMVKSIFGHNLSIKDFAVLHGLEPRQGYSRFDRLRAGLRRKLEKLGIQAEEALRIIGWSESALHLALDSDDDDDDGNGGS